MKKILFTLALLVSFSSFGQQFSINELIEMSLNTKLYERKMFSKGNQMTRKETEVWFNYTKVDNSLPKEIFICSGETIGETYEKCPASKNPEYKLLKRERNYVKFAENYNSKEKKATTFYSHYNHLDYKDSGINLERLDKGITLLYIRNDDFYRATKYLANNTRFEYKKTFNTTYNGLTTRYFVKQSNSEFQTYIDHYEDEREEVGGTISISSYKNL